MKTFLTCSFLLVLIICSCEKETQPVEVEEFVAFTANGQTRTVEPKDIAGFTSGFIGAFFQGDSLLRLGYKRDTDMLQISIRENNLADGQYNLNDTNTVIFTDVYDNNRRYYTDSNHRGKIVFQTDTIESESGSYRILKGTFNFLARDTSPTRTINVLNGSFQLKRF